MKFTDLPKRQISECHIIFSSLVLSFLVLASRNYSWGEGKLFADTCQYFRIQKTHRAWLADALKDGFV